MAEDTSAMTNKTPVLLGALGVVAALAGCGTTNPGSVPPITGLVHATAKDRFVVQAPLGYYEMRGVGVRWDEGVLACTFTPKFENAEGVYYEGGGKCVNRTMNGKAMGGPFYGGVWIPRRPGAAPRLYYYFDFDDTTVTRGGGPIVAAFLGQARGELSFMPEIKDRAFLAALENRRTR